MVCIREDKIVINDYIENDPLSEENLNKTLDLVNEIRLSFPNKSIWIYSGYRWSEIFNDGVYLTKDCAGWKRREIVKQCSVLVDGQYIDSKRNPLLKWRGSSNQQVIDIKKSLKENIVVLYCN